MDVSRYEFACQKALHQGLQYARSLGHQWLEVEHVALALLRAEEVTLKARSGERLKRHLENHLSRSPRIFGNIKIEFGRRLDAALDAAEAQSGDGLVTTAVLWNMLCRQSTVIQTFLHKAAQDADAKSEAFEPLVMQQASGDSPTNAKRVSPRATEPAGKVSDKLEKELRQFTVDLSAVAERGELDPVVGRDVEVRRVLEILGRKKKNNPLLIGEPGVGKSAVAEAIALRIAEGLVPESMRGKRVLSLDLGAMLAGAKYRGEFEDRMKNLLKAMEALKGRVILFIDEIHMLVGAGNHEGGTDAANLLKPALARGELQCLGATTIDEYRRYIEKDPALERRFQPLYVDEPSPETALSILRGIKARYEIHHGVQIDDDALLAAVNLSMRYLSGRKLPDKAIDLVDEAASRLRLQIDSVPAILDELKSEIGRIEIERKAVGDEASHQSAMAVLDVRLEKAKAEHHRIEDIWRRHQGLLESMKMAEKQRQESMVLYDNAKAQGDFDFAARLQYGELPRLDRELSAIREQLTELQQQHAFLRQVVGAREVAEVVAAWTRIPVGRLLEDDARKLVDIESRLARRVYGQDTALRRIARAVKRARVGVNDPRRPTGVFLFLGPTGVGKTETAKALAAELFADESKIVRVDMSEFMEQHSVARLIGAPPGYVGFGDGGSLTEAVRHKPYSVVLFDEIEKAHPRVLDVMLQIFDDGRLTDGKGKTVDFRNTLVILTSNLPLDTLIDPVEASDNDVRMSLARQLRPELVNRIDEVVVFRRLAREHLEHLLARLVSELNDRLRERQLRLSVGSRLADRLIVEGLRGPFGGRALRRAFEVQVIDTLSDRILERPDLAMGAWMLDLDEDEEYRWSPEDKPHFYLPPPPGR